MYRYSNNFFQSTQYKNDKTWFFLHWSFTSYWDTGNTCFKRCCVIQSQSDSDNWCLFLPSLNNYNLSQVEELPQIIAPKQYIIIRMQHNLPSSNFTLLDKTDALFHISNAINGCQKKQDCEVWSESLAWMLSLFHSSLYTSLALTFKWPKGVMSSEVIWRIWGCWVSVWGVWMKLLEDVSQADHRFTTSSSLISSMLNIWNESAMPQ